LVFLNAVLLIALQPDPGNLRGIFEQRLERTRTAYGRSDPRTGQAARDLGLFLREQGDASGARTALEDAFHILKTPEDAANLAGVSPPSEAAPLWEQAAQSGDAKVASDALASLGELSEAAGDRTHAAEFYQRALAKETGPRAAVRLNALALVLGPKEGIGLLERALAINRKAWGEAHPETATTEANLSGLLLAAGRVMEAVRMGRAALAGFERTLGPEHPRAAAAASNLADALRTQGDKVGAERLYRRALAIDEAAYGARHPETLADVRNLTEFLRECGRAKEAAELELRLR
jgi:tetratricopeptide (TPR) repeat protein